MNICILDGREIKDRMELHNKIEISLGFPYWYGRNLDALYDCLTDVEEEAEIWVFYKSEMEEYLGIEYVQALIKVIQRAAEANNKIKLGMEETCMGKSFTH